MEQEILDIIKKNLPEQTVGILREQLELIPELQKEVFKLSKEISMVDEALEIQRVKIEELEGSKAQLEIELAGYKRSEVDLQLRSDTLERQESKLEKFIAEERLRMTDSFLTKYEDMLKIVFRSPVYKETVAKKGEVPVVLRSYNYDGKATGESTLLHNVDQTIQSTKEEI